MCELCKNTGWYGDNGPGIKGNREYLPCECRSVQRDLLWLLRAIRASQYLDNVRSITCSEYMESDSSHPANPLCKSPAEGKGCEASITIPNIPDPQRQACPFL